MYFSAAPAFLATYSALGVEVGSVTGDLSVYMAGTTLSEGKSMLGGGIAIIKVPDEDSPEIAPIFFSGTRIATGQ